MTSIAALVSQLFSKLCYGGTQNLYMDLDYCMHTSIYIGILYLFELEQREQCILALTADSTSLLTAQLVS